MSETGSKRSGEDDGLPGLQFPVLCFSQGGGFFDVGRSLEEITTANRLGLKRGWFDGLVIVGANSMALRVKRARKLRGVGRFGGHNVFLNQTIRVALEFDGPPFEMSLDAAKSKVHHSLTKEYDFWSSGESVPRLRSQVNQAQSIDEIVQLFEEPPEAKAWAAEQRSFKRRLRSLLTYVVILGAVVVAILLQERFS